ncbi:MAG TPA: aldehyde dehydrogenase family protein [Candidatus Limnocylindrales bacterium]
MTTEQAIQGVQMVIGGRQVDATDGRTFDVVEPHRGETIARVAQGTPADVDAAVAAAQAAFDSGWGTMPAIERARMMLKLAAAVREHHEELSQLESRNIGKPISGARWEIGRVSDVLEFYAGAVQKIHGETIPTTRPGFDFTLREPVGVVGLIVPWNFPLYLASWKMGPALAAGNTIIVKPASWSPLTAVRFAEIALEAGIPAGVVNVVTGPGASVGAALAAHPGVGKIGFTGETATGQEIMRLAATNVKKVSLELGGKSPNIVFADADVERFGAESPYSVFDNSGQDCCARSRIIVHRSIHDRVVEAFVEGTKRMKVGDPSDPSTEVGPLVTFSHRKRVQDYIEAGKADGAQLVCGGGVPADPGLANGAYLMPTVFDHATTGMSIVREEIFGPVVAVIPFDTEEEAVALANATPYGLSGSVWTRDIARAIKVAKAVQTGVISVNCNNSVHIEAPFGGYKMSGLGRDLGLDAIREYTEIKNVYVDLRDAE